MSARVATVIGAGPLATDPVRPWWSFAEEVGTEPPQPDHQHRHHRRALPDSKALEGIHQSQQRRDLLPDEHYLDSGYPSAELITGSLTRYGVALITPVLSGTSRQAKAKEGFADFTIDWEKQQATCPAGHTSTTWNPVA